MIRNYGLPAILVLFAWVCTTSDATADGKINLPSESPVTEEIIADTEVQLTSADDVVSGEPDYESYVYGLPTPELPWVGQDANFRFGWWAADQSGDPTKVGEFQDLDGSPFFDIDGIFSNGERTFNFTATGQDDEANTGKFYLYDPRFTIKLDYDRYIRRLDHEPLPFSPVVPGEAVVGDDLNVGDDYAIRVQELKATIKGDLGSNVKWRLNLWGMKKSGERQTNAASHCFDPDGGGPVGNTCHVLSQSQRIDWTTMEIEPVVEAQLGDFNVSYARTMRWFGQDDQVVERTYNHFGPYDTDTPYPYAFTPDNYTQIDRIKVAGPVINDCNHLYAYGYIGNTHDEFRDTQRDFGGYDLRWTNRSREGLTLTTYTKMLKQQSDFPPPFDLTNPDETVDDERVAPYDYLNTKTGIKARWTPYRDRCSDGCFDRLETLALTAGYEYYTLERNNAEHDTRRGDQQQRDTERHELRLGANMNWSPCIDTFARYRVRFTHDPLLGGNTQTGWMNTNQPEQEHGVDIGGTWTPQKNLMASVQFSAVNSWNSSQYNSDDGFFPIDFTEDSYPIVATIWYAPTEKVSLTGGYAYFTNWVDQDVGIGFRDTASVSEIVRADYEGTNELISLNATYAHTECLSFVCGLERNAGTNLFVMGPSTKGADWSQLGTYSDVDVITWRYTAGIDYQFSPRLGTYLRYNYFDYEDMSENYNSGTVHYFLAGVNATY